MAAAENASRPAVPPAYDLAAHTRHQIGVRLLPFLFVLYVVNYLDRTNVAYAALEMSRDLGFSDRVFGMGAGIFFVSYVALQIPGAMLVERWSARRCITAIMISWGSLTVLTALVHTAGQLYLARFVLGAAEAGFFPGVVVYLSHWFIQEDRGKASGNFMAAIPLSFILGSPLAGWILGFRWGGVEGWRWLFILEGLPAVLLGVAAFFYLTDWPRQAHWLSPEQSRWLAGKLEEEKPANKHSISVWGALRSRSVVLLASAAFLEYFVGYTVVFWFPTVLKRVSGYSDAHVGWLGTIPYVVAFLAMQINGWHSDRKRERRWHSAVPVFTAAVALAGLIIFPLTTFSTVALFAMMCVCWGFLPVFWTMPTELLSESAAATAVGLINAVGSIAGFAGPYLFGYLNTLTGSYRYGLAVMMLCAITSGLLLVRIPHAVGARSPRIMPTPVLKGESGPAI